MRENATREKLRRGETVVGLMLLSADAHVVGVIAATGFDYVMFDLEHTSLSYERLERLVHAADAATLPPLNADLVTARALAPLTDLLPLVARHLAPAGTALLPKGATVEAELTAAAPLWTMRVERFPSRTDPAATILRLTEVARARRSP